MIVKILGILDLIVGILFWLFGIFNIIPSNIILILGFILLAKGIAFIINLNPASILDVICAFVIISATSIILPKLVIILISLFLIQKGILSVLG